MRPLSLTLLLPICLMAQTAPTTLKLWPNGTPGTTSTAGAEADTTKSADALIAGKRLIRLGNVSEPTLTLYSPVGKNTGAAVAVFPGGGYHILAMDLEGTEVCEWLNGAGVSCIVVKYRVPDSGPFPKSPVALQDAQRAVSLIRMHAAELKIDPHRIGVLGFSAGGHLAAAISTNYKSRVYESIDSVDNVSCRPDFTILIYPAYLTQSVGVTSLNASLPVDSNTPPAFLAQTEDDSGAPVENSFAYYLALKNAKVPAELHVYAKGGHGYGLRKTDLPVTSWPTAVETWLHTSGILGDATSVASRVVH